MGVVHKLKPDVAEFILAAKKAHPGLGCRVLAQQAKHRFDLEVSKSSINSLIKNAGLSMPVGRRSRLRHGQVECSGLGVFFLKAADELLGLTLKMSQVIHARLHTNLDETHAFVQHLLYVPLFGAGSVLQAQEYLLPQLLRRQVSDQESEQFLAALEQDAGVASELISCLADQAVCVRYYKIDFSDGSCCYLDAQLHTAWSRPGTPEEFAVPVHKAKLDAQAVFSGAAPLSLFLAPGYEAPTREFACLARSMRGEIAITQVTLCGHNSEEIARIIPEKKQDRFLICGIWPWQFSGSINVKVASEFRRYIFLPLKKEYLIAPVDIDFGHLEGFGGLTLKGVALKSGEEQDISLVIAACYGSNKFNMDSVANEYFSHWAEPEAILKDYSKKIEADVSGSMPEPRFSFEKPFDSKQPTVKEAMELCRQMLDWHVRRYFLPLEYANQGITSIQERFYGLKGVLTRKKEYTTVDLRIPPKYPFRQDLLLACQHSNQMRPASPRLYFRI